MAGLLTEQSDRESQEATHHPRGRKSWGCTQALRAEASLRRKHGRPLEDVVFHSDLHVHSYFSTQLVHVWGTQVPQHLGSRGTNSKFWRSSVRSQRVAQSLPAVSVT